ncbi:MAG TPA: hypothetical protein DFS52_07675 [Myxococcales bacterium]|nr:hypothetical protein [Myxococcales bacterium]
MPAPHSTQPVLTMRTRFLHSLLALALVTLACAAETEVAPPQGPVTSASRDVGAEVSGAMIHLRNWRWQDVMNNMQRLKDAGFTALLLSPHTSTCGGDYSEGYDPYDFTRFDGRFGSEHDLYWLVRTAHHFGLQVYADMVMNHMCSRDSWSYPRFGYNDFHHEGDVWDWNDPYALEHGMLWGLHDLAHESEYVRSELFNFLVKTNNLGFDGYRWDAAKHVPLWYWRDHVVNNTNAWGKFSFGEVFDGRPEVLASYAEAGMAVTDYNLYFALKEAFRFGGDLSKLDGAGYAARDGLNAVTFVENHDVEAPENRLLAYAFICAYPGYPSFENTPLDDPTMLNLVWIHGNKARGTYRNLHKERDVLIFERGDSLLAAFNQSGEWQSRWVRSRWTDRKLNDYTGHVQGDAWTDGGGWVEVKIPPMSYVMLAP